MDMLDETLDKFQLFPLQGTPDEWEDISHYLNDYRYQYQNKRCSRIFAEDVMGKNAKDIDYYIFVSKDGKSFTCPESVKQIEFPYIPQEPIKIIEGTPEAKQFKDIFE